MPKPLFRFHPATFLPALALVCASTNLRAQAPSPTVPPNFTQFIIFGDSLSDVGNDSDLSDESYGIRFPGPDLADTLEDPAVGYTDGRFTDGTDTTPAAVLYSGVWHEQLARLFLGTPVATASLDHGFDFAYGGATTASGQGTLSEGDGAVSIKVDNMGRQVATYLDANTPDPKALYIVWGGANDLFNDDDASTVTTAVSNEAALITQLATAGAAVFLVPNIPPLGATPDYNTNASTSAAFNANSAAFRDQLNTALDTVQTRFPGITIYRLDVYTLFQRLEANEAAYGFTNITDASQGTSDPDHRLFWDGVHPTTAGHYQLAAEAYTLLTGYPVVEINPKTDNSGFWLTRTGTDVSKALLVDYSVHGTAVSGTDFEALPGVKKFRPNKQTVSIDVTPTSSATAGERVKLKLSAEESYVRPVVKTAGITLP